MSGLAGNTPPRAVRPAYLLGFAARCILIAAAAFAAFAVVMLVAADVELPQNYGGIGAAVDTAANRLAWVIIPAAAICAAFVGAGCAFVAIRASHKIAGPVYRLAADLRRMAGGDYDFVVATRRNDQLKDVSESLEKARSALQGRLLRLKDCAGHIANAAEAEQPSAEDLGRHLLSFEDALSQQAQRQEAGS